ncbi:hypothetical protein PA08_0307 [Cutibacterium modestum P08]|nr:hypothetical protein PA08_0307 [Cutibacterium modestum P08]
MDVLSNVLHLNEFIFTTVCHVGDVAHYLKPHTFIHLDSLLVE